MTQQFATIDRRTEVNHTPPPNRTHSTRNVMRKISDVIENRFFQPSIAQVVSTTCLYIDTTFRNSIELSRYGHFTANPATREPRGECDETVKIARMIRPAVIFVYEQQKLLVYKHHWVQTRRSYPLNIVSSRCFLNLLIKLNLLTDFNIKSKRYRHVSKITVSI